MISILADDATDAFQQICEYLTIEGIARKTRNGKSMLELLDVIVEIADPRRRVISTAERHFPVKCAKREFLWYMTHNPKVDLIGKYLPFWKTCSDNGEIVNSNYGAIWHTQINHVIERLKNSLKEEESDRRAAIAIYDASFANYYGKDMPCTLNVTLNVRDNKLYMSTMMRSNDVITGFCIDQFTWTCLQELIANELGVEVGTYTHHAVSMHIYEQHYEMMRHCYDGCDQDESKQLQSYETFLHTTTYSNFWDSRDPYIAFDEIEFDEWRSNVINCQSFKSKQSMSISMM